jgi:glucose/arabinose dehydrogenase
MLGGPRDPNPGRFMPSQLSLAASLALLLALAGCQPQQAGAIAGADGLVLQPIAEGLDQPVHLTAPAGDPRLFVVEQPGRIRIIANDRVLDRPFLDLTKSVRSGGERGLLSLAFHPRYSENGHCFVNYTDASGATRIVRFSVTADPDVADPASARDVMTIEQPYSNHNGGHILFGPDGLLYVGMGDGGAANDPHGNGRNRHTLLGALLRIDVDGGARYAIPSGNPYAAGRGRAEVWATGVRNPWRLWIDPVARLLYVADVGQNAWEEVSVAPLAAAGLDYGWNVMEGRHCFRSGRCDTTGLVVPVIEYGRGDGCSITGGIVYRGKAVPELQGVYVYSDYCTGWIRGFRYAAGAATEPKTWVSGRVGSISSFGVGGDGEAYVITLEGAVLRIAAPPEDAAR